MVDMSSFDSVLNFIQYHGYLIIFLIMIVEGPIVITATSFAASLGYFNIWIIFILGCLGDIIGDALIYYIGYIGRKKFIKNYGHFFGIKQSTLKKIKGHFSNHMGKTLFTAKMTPLAVPVLMMAGASKVPVRKYAFWNLVIIFPKTIFFTTLGYFFGVFADSILSYYQRIEYYIIALIIGVVVIYWLGKKISEKLFNLNKI